MVHKISLLKWGSMEPSRESGSMEFQLVPGYTKERDMRQTAVISPEGHMYIKQLSITLTNLAQSIGQATGLLAQHCINIRAVSFTEKSNASILNLIVNDTEKAREIFTANGYGVSMTDVVVIEVPDKPGGLASVMLGLGSPKLQVSYLSSFSQKSGESGLIILAFNDSDMAVKLLQKAGIHMLSHAELFAR